MKLSTRSRYGVRFMTALACEDGDNSLLLKDIAAGEGISGKYLSLIVIPLRAAGLINSLRGAHGGYSLARAPQDITLCDIVEALEGETCLVRCVKQPLTCERAAICPARDVWRDLGDKIRETLKSVTIAELAEKMKENNNKINTKRTTKNIKN
ncbi:MAG: Rrf2 family transcriptional regulator [Smithella sp.]|nr:Rrf2 family transcriptional regulator [Syntrophaceae bacterium]